MLLSSITGCRFCVFTAAAIFLAGAMSVHAQEPFDPFGGLAKPPDPLAEELKKIKRAAELADRREREPVTLLTFDELLRLPVRAEIDDCEWKDIVDTIAESTKIEIAYDNVAWITLMIDPYREITLDLGDKPLPIGRLLNLTLQKANPKLVAAVKNEMIWVTTEERSFGTSAYDLRDLLDRAVAAEAKKDKQPRSRDELAADLLQRVSALAPETWHEQGGRGRATLFREQLVVAQTASVQWQIREYLQKSRVALGADDAVQKEPVIEIAPAETSRFFLKLHDKNRDGFLQPEEFDRLRDQFPRFDADKDGKWSVKELDKAVRVQRRRR